jgi:conjugal transfer pilus assembly protein TraB
MIQRLKYFIDQLTLRQKQLILMSGGGIFFIAVVGVGINIFTSRPSKSIETDKPQVYKENVKNLTKSLSGIDDKAIWVDRLQTENEQKAREIEEVKAQNKLLEKKFDVLEELFTKTVEHNEKQTQQIGLNEDARIAQEHEEKLYAAANRSTLEVEPIPSKKGNKIVRISFGSSSQSYKNATNYLPSGSYAKAVLLTGAASLTGTNASTNPKPLTLRLIDDGHLPRGFTSRVRDAHVIAACYGEISSERLICRLQTMSWVEKDGTTIERKIEGYVSGEDGREGIRGKVVDRSGEVTRQAMYAGVLSAMASFFQAESSKSVFPVSPFGQTNAMSTNQLITGAAANGASNAFEKLADYTIRRAEQMQPVILISPGRVIDIVFQTGVDVSPVSNPELSIERHTTSSHSNDYGELNE